MTEVKARYCTPMGPCCVHSRRIDQTVGIKRSILSFGLNSGAQALYTPYTRTCLSPGTRMHWRGRGLGMCSAGPATDMAELEGRIAEQGNKVRIMKEMIKTDSMAHSKEELDAEITKLKALKAELDVRLQVQLFHDASVCSSDTRIQKHSNDMHAYMRGERNPKRMDALSAITHMLVSTSTCSVRARDVGVFTFKL